MEIFTVSETRTTPKIHFDLSWGILDIKGVSIPEYPREYYQPLLDAITKYGEHPKEITTINFSLIYFNSSSTRSLLTILNAFRNLGLSKDKLRINWYYDVADEDQLETVRDLEALANMEFNYIGV